MKKNFTKKILCMLALMISLISVTNAQVLFTDNFTYSGALTSNGWTAHSGGGTNPVSTTGGLVYPGILTSNIGNAALIQSVSGEDVNITFTPQSTDGQSIYLSALVNISETASSKTGDYFLHLGPSPIGSSFVARVAAKITADVVNFGIGASTTITYGTTAFAKNTTYLLVVKYTISTAGNENVSLWVIGSGVPASEGAAGAAEVMSSAAAQNSIGAVALRQGAAASMPATVVDGLMIGLSWADVTPTGSVSPTITAGPAVTGLAATVGAPSPGASFNVAGTNLTGAPGNLTATAGTDFEVSLATGGPYGPSVNIPYATATLAATPVYVRIAATAPAGPVSGSVTLAGGGDTDGASVAVSGIVTQAEPTVQASNVTFSAISNTGFTVNWTNGNGASRIVTLRAGAATQVAPVDGTSYTIGSTALGSNGIYYVGSGSGPLVITGLTPGTSYTVKVYEFNGTGNATNYLTTDGTVNPASTTTTGTAPTLTQANFTSISAPQFGASGTSTRLPVMFYATVSGLKANTTYRYYTLADLASNFGGNSSGAGIPISIDYTQGSPAFFYSATGDLRAAGSHGKFTTNASGSFTGSFGYVNSGNATRFTANAVVYPTITLGEEATYTNTQHMFALNDGIKILEFDVTPTDSTGSFIKGESTAIPGNLVGLWSTVDGNLVAQRPLAMTLSEGVSFGGPTAWASSFIAGYDQNESSWNTIIPNQNGNGVRLIQQFDLRSGQVLGCNSDADGIWPSGANTVNPAVGTGSTPPPAPIQITEPDATLTGGSCFGIVLPVRVSSFAVQKQGTSSKISWTTEQEINSKEFVVERSTDQRVWTVVATVPAAGSSASRINYNTTDFAPAKGINFYRLRSVDIDNRFENSATRSVLFGNADVVLITPNPASTFATIYMGKNNNSLSQIFVTDMNGKLVERINTADQTHTLQTARYSKGLYMIKVVTEGNTSTHKLVVQ